MMDSPYIWANSVRILEVEKPLISKQNHVTVPKLVNIVCALGKWGKIAPNTHHLAICFEIAAHFRLEVGEIVHSRIALPNLERSLKSYLTKRQELL
jgi:hypothetical protein